MPKLDPSSKSSSNPGFRCFEPRCQRYNTPYRTISGLQKHLESVLRHFPDRQSKRGEEARQHNVNRVLRELHLDSPEVMEQEHKLEHVVQKRVQEDGYEVHQGESDGAIEYWEEDELVETEDDEVVEVIPQHTPVASSTGVVATSGSGTRHIYTRRTPNATTYEHRHTQNVPKEIVPISRDRGVYLGGRKQSGFSDPGSGHAAGSIRKGFVAGRSSTQFNQFPAEAGPSDEHVSRHTNSRSGNGTHSPIPRIPTASNPSCNSIATPTGMPSSYRLRIYTHYNFLRVGNGWRILDTAEYPTYSAISAVILSGLRYGPGGCMEPFNWRIDYLTVVGRLSPSGVKERFEVRDEGDWRNVTENVLSVEAEGELIEVQVALEAT